ncbi:MAG: response regulator [Nitrospirales bacterium]|nr:response regulator [Nitrospirales bacterium]
MKILIMDDEKLFLSLCKKELEDEGYDVVTANSGQEALDLFEKEAPDLATLDIMMKGQEMDGIQVLQKMKEKNPSLPVILLTSYGVYKDDFRVWGCDKYVIKSSDPSELKQAIKDLLKEKEQ